METDRLYYVCPHCRTCYEVTDPDFLNHSKDMKVERKCRHCGGKFLSWIRTELVYYTEKVVGGG